MRTSMAKKATTHNTTVITTPIILNFIAQLAWKIARSRFPFLHDSFDLHEQIIAAIPNRMLPNIHVRMESVSQFLGGGPTGFGFWFTCTTDGFRAGFTGCKQKF